MLILANSLTPCRIFFSLSLFLITPQIILHSPSLSIEKRPADPQKAGAEMPASKIQCLTSSLGATVEGGANIDGVASTSSLDTRPSVGKAHDSIHGGRSAFAVPASDHEPIRPQADRIAVTNITREDMPSQQASSSRVNDPAAHFGDYVAATLRELTPACRARLQHAIVGCIAESQET